MAKIPTYTVTLNDADYTAVVTRTKPPLLTLTFNRANWAVIEMMSTPITEKELCKFIDQAKKAAMWQRHLQKSEQ